MNFVAINGRLTSDPELKTVGSGISVCTINVAVGRSYTKQDEEKQTDFFTCTFWRQGAEFISKFFRRGQEIIVTGEMQSRKYQDKDGNNRIAWGIENCHAEFCGSKKDNQSQAVTGTVEITHNFEVIDDDDATLPF